MILSQRFLLLSCENLQPEFFFQRKSCIRGGSTHTILISYLNSPDSITVIPLQLEFPPLLRLLLPLLGNLRLVSVSCSSLFKPLLAFWSTALFTSSHLLKNVHSSSSTHSSQKPFLVRPIFLTLFAMRPIKQLLFYKQAHFSTFVPLHYFLGRMDVPFPFCPSFTLSFKISSKIHLIVNTQRILSVPPRQLSLLD